MSHYLLEAVRVKSALDESIAQFRIQASLDLANGRPLQRRTLMVLCREFYRHERWVRGLSHQAAAREVSEMLARLDEKTIDLLRGVLTQRVLHETMTRSRMAEWLADRQGVLGAAVAKIIRDLEAEGMGTDPAYLSDPV